jgi:RNA polymerase sigma-70 factor (ECF subfamily)
MSATDKKRFDGLMANSYKKVFNLVYRLSGNRTDAEDLTQEAYYRAYRSFNDFEGDKPFENWIYRIASRLFLDLLRNRKRRIRAVSYDAPLSKDSGEEGLYFEIPDRSPNPETGLLMDTLSEDLQRAMNSLSQDQRVLVILADVEGMPYREIADVLDKPVGTVRSRLHRTHRLLRSRMDMIEKGHTGTFTRKRLKLQAAS